jgi:hypothetical protein
MNEQEAAAAPAEVLPAPAAEPAPAPAAPAPAKTHELVGKKIQLTELERTVGDSLLSRAATLRKAAATIEDLAKLELRGAVLTRSGVAPDVIKRAKTIIHVSAGGAPTALEIASIEQEPSPK